MLDILENDGSVKFLVFSQWEGVLDIIGNALSTNGIGFIKLEGGKVDGKRIFKGQAVISFQQNPNIKCIMLNSKSQSSGLTLVEATHVFLVEPLLNLGLERQAMTRVNRIGQKSVTHVWRYIISGTIEENIGMIYRPMTGMAVDEVKYQDYMRLFDIALQSESSMVTSS